MVPPSKWPVHISNHHSLDIFRYKIDPGKRFFKPPLGDRALKNCPVEGRALIKHPVGVFSEEPDCSDGIASPSASLRRPKEGASLQGRIVVGAGGETTERK